MTRTTRGDLDDASNCWRSRSRDRWSEEGDDSDTIETKNPSKVWEKIKPLVEASTAWRRPKLPSPYESAATAWSTSFCDQPISKPAKSLTAEKRGIVPPVTDRRSAGERAGRQGEINAVAYRPSACARTADKKNVCPTRRSPASSARTSCFPAGILDPVVVLRASQFELEKANDA